MMELLKVLKRERRRRKIGWDKNLGWFIFSNSDIWKKYATFPRHELSSSRDGQHCFKFYMEKGVISTYRMRLGMLGLLMSIALFGGALQSVALL